MAIRANFQGITSDEAAQLTMDWINRSGLFAIQSWDDLFKQRPLYIELKETPAILKYFGQLEDELSISSITDQGITFYITDVTLWLNIPKEEQIVSAERPDGFVFCPMSNVICINDFGNLLQKKTITSL